MRARDNPFRVEQIHKLSYRPQGFSWDEILRRLAELNYRAAVVGPEGSGKTTFLEHLAPRLAECGFKPLYLRVQPELRFIREFAEQALSLDVKHILLVDGVELFSRVAWWKFRSLSKPLAGLVVSLHSPSRLPTLFETTTTDGLFRELVGELIGSAATQRAAGELNRLFAASDGNVRIALRQCYDAYSEHGALPST